jgi:hypothetical protein
MRECARLLCSSPRRGHGPAMGGASAAAPSGVVPVDVAFTGAEAHPAVASASDSTSVRAAQIAPAVAATPSTGGAPALAVGAKGASAEGALWRLSYWLDALQVSAVANVVKGSVCGVPVNARVAVIPVFGGTAVNGFSPEEGSGVYPALTCHGVGSIRTTTMTREFWRQLVPAEVWRCSPTLEWKLGTLAGHMRLVDWFVRSLLPRTDVPSSWDDIVGPLRDPMAWRDVAVRDALTYAELKAKKAFNGWLEHSSRPQLIAALVLGVHVPRNAELDGVSVDEVVKFAPVALEPAAGGAVRMSASALALRVMCGVAGAPQHAPFTAAVSSLLDAVLDCTSLIPLGFEGFELICALQLSIQKMGYALLGTEVTLGSVFRGAVFAGGSRDMVFSPALAPGAPLPDLRTMGVVMSQRQFPAAPIVDRETGGLVAVHGAGPVVVNGASAEFADVATRLVSGVDEFLCLKRYVEGDLKMTMVSSEVKKVEQELKQWRDVAPVYSSSAVVVMSLGHYAGGKDATDRTRCAGLATKITSVALSLPTVVVCRGAGLEELFGPLLDSVALRCRKYVPPPPSCCACSAVHCQCLCCLSRCSWCRQWPVTMLVRLASLFCVLPESSPCA